MKATLISGPDWTASERFDVSATLPAGSARAQLPEMFQALLADRFQVKLHKDKKDFAVDALLVGKGGLKMKEAFPDPNERRRPAEGHEHRRDPPHQQRRNRKFRPRNFLHLREQPLRSQVSMALFAPNLERFADRQIVDMTGLIAQYDFAFDVMPEEYIAMSLRAAVWGGVVLPPEAQKMLDASSPAALGDALQQIGLRLDARKAPLRCGSYRRRAEDQSWNFLLRASRGRDTSVRGWNAISRLPSAYPEVPFLKSHVLTRRIADLR
jgi:uncharacterized protein (TIGR03435 family)